MSKPGFMVYFADCDLMEELEDSEFRQLFRAMRDFAETGTVPDFENRFLRIAWKSVLQGLQRDDARYSNVVINSQYAVYCREEKRAGRKPLSMDDWKMSLDIGRQRSITDDNEPDQNYPTTTTTATPIPNTFPTTAAVANTPMTDTAAAMLHDYGITESEPMKRAVIEDISKYGEANVREALRRAAESDKRGGVSVAFYHLKLSDITNGRSTMQSVNRTAPSLSFDYMSRGPEYWKKLEEEIDARQNAGIL